MSAPELDYGDLALAATLLVLNAGLSLALQLDIARKLVVSALRMVLQLALIGVVLKSLFAASLPTWTALAALVMVLLAGREIMARQEHRLRGPWAYGLGTGCMLAASFLVTVFALTTQVRPDPWYEPALRAAAPRHGAREHDDRNQPGPARADARTAPRTRRRGSPALPGAHALRGRPPGSARSSAQRAHADPELDGRRRRHRPARDDDRSDPGRRRAVDRGRVPDPDLLPDRGWYDRGERDRRLRRLVPADRRASPVRLERLR